MKQQCKRTINQHNLSSFIILALLIGSGCCSVTLISGYDEITDAAITQLQRKVGTFLVEIQRNVGTSEAGYEKRVKFYDEVRIDIDAISVRAAAREKNEITVNQLKNLQESIDSLEKLHKLGFNKFEELEPLRQAFDRIFTAILKLELAKKR
jgi:hypothetical protein